MWHAMVNQSLVSAVAGVGSDLLALEFAPLDSAVAARELDAQVLQRCVRFHLLQLHPIHT